MNPQKPLTPRRADWLIVSNYMRRRWFVYIPAVMAGLVAANQSVILGRNDSFDGFGIFLAVLAIPGPFLAGFSSVIIFVLQPDEIRNKALRCLPFTKARLGRAYWMIGIASVPPIFLLSYAVGTTYRFWIEFTGFYTPPFDTSSVSPFEYERMPENLLEIGLTIIAASGFFALYNVGAWCQTWLSKRTGPVLSFLTLLAIEIGVSLAFYRLMVNAWFRPESVPFWSIALSMTLCVLFVFASALLSTRAVDTVVSAVATEGKKKRDTSPHTYREQETSTPAIDAENEENFRFPFLLMGPPRLPGMLYRSIIISLGFFLTQLLILSLLFLIGPLSGAEAESNLKHLAEAAPVFLTLFLGIIALIPIYHLRTLRALPISRNGLTLTLAGNVVALYVPWALASAGLLILMGDKSWVPFFATTALIGLGGIFIAQALLAASSNGIWFAAGLWFAFFIVHAGAQSDVYPSYQPGKHVTLSLENYNAIVDTLEARSANSSEQFLLGKIFLPKYAIPLSLLLMIAGTTALRLVIQYSSNAYRSPPNHYANPRGVQ